MKRLLPFHVPIEVVILTILCGYTLQLGSS